MWSKLKQIIGKTTSDTKTYADFYLQYLEAYYKPDLKKSIHEQSFVVLDTETTGLDLGQDNILSIGAVRIINNTIDISDSLSIIVKNQQLQTQNAVAIHGLVQTDIKGQSEAESIAALFKFVGSDIIVGHHIAFDIAMLNKLSRKNGGGDLKNNLLDTSYLARRLDHTTDPDSLDRKEYTLDKLCSRFKVIPKARHTADGDAFITAIVFMKLIQKLYIKGVTSTGQLVRK
ncbi:MAG: 3'-5' exonuclease [Saprospiraceae bacterium]|jgi:DNA polymerase-3 subunit epsilon|nr:3'-5' exonuclease [Saprospiraceae bacterium]MBP6568212.1 3'-5' exonuclease [Saprospiraceae bacterium]